MISLIHLFYNIQLLVLLSLEKRNILQFSDTDSPECNEIEYQKSNLH